MKLGLKSDVGDGRPGAICPEGGAPDAGDGPAGGPIWNAIAGNVSAFHEKTAGSVGVPSRSGDGSFKRWGRPPQ